MITKDLDDKLINVFKDCPYKGKRKDCTFPEMREMEKDCPYKGKRKDCTFPEMREMEIDDRLDFLDKMDEDEKITRWQKHLVCLMNALAK
ncbi:MAG: hypothetical protein JRE10_16740 [Deltaproteobacteria bacterium]|nr:hypothetical protein [Deltaproteobacteria bacterium]